MNLLKVLFPVLLLTLFLSASAQRSPGELSKAHAFLEGTGKCTQCHDEGNRVTRSKCLNCHIAIKNNIAARKGYHASAEVAVKDCSACHNEHHGRNFHINPLNRKTFNHASTGFALQGEHARQDCNACHQPGFIKDPVLKKKAGTFLGLSQECLNCHDDYHQGRMSPRCNTCHGFETFKQSTGFDHSKTRFPLLGQHKKVNCIACHKEKIINGKRSQNFSGLVFQNCTGCHQDVHQNKFGQDCKQCHTEESFHFNKSMKVFDHNKTNFPLLGEHQQVDCKECHKGSMTAPLKHTQCKDCHIDYHHGEFAKNNTTPDCKLCHNNNGFTPSTFTIEKHKKVFPLDGAHLATSCNECHHKTKNWKFRNIGKRCVDCHKNEHKGFIEERFFPNEECTACHTTDKWSAVTFDHHTTGFDLSGQHARIACSQCHYGKNDKGLRTQKFQGLLHECASCHKEPHAGQFAINGKTDCSRCHGFNSFLDSKFDHNTSRFKLNGAHAKVACEECHKPIMNEKGRYIQYKFDDISCASCHKN